jgi:hypothetical protein
MRLLRLALSAGARLAVAGAWDARVAGLVAEARGGCGGGGSGGGLRLACDATGLDVEVEACGGLRVRALECLGSVAVALGPARTRAHRGVHSGQTHRLARRAAGGTRARGHARADAQKCTRTRT